MSSKIEKLYAWICDQKDGQGIVTIDDGGRSYPLISHDVERVKEYQDIIEQVAAQQKVKISLVEFSIIKVLATVEPRHE